MMKKPIAIFILALCTGIIAVPAYAQLFGPSDEEKAAEAAAKAREDTQDQEINQLQGQLRDLADKIRTLTESLAQLTGTNEELGHQIQLENDKIDRMQKDFAYRLCTLSTQQLGANDAINCAAQGTASASTPIINPQAQPGAAPSAVAPQPNSEQTNNQAALLPPPEDNQDQVALGRPPGILGTLPLGSANGAPTPLTAPQAPPAQAAAQAPQDGARYQTAMNLLTKAQYSEAAAAFRAYADAHPDDNNLSPQAIYWIGDINFMRQDYGTAARNFAELIKKYPKSTRASDAMLKLAQSFMALGQNSEGCTTLALIKSKYPDATAQTLAAATNLRKTACTR